MDDLRTVFLSALDVRTRLIEASGNVAVAHILNRVRRDFEEAWSRYGTETQKPAPPSESLREMAKRMCDSFEECDSCCPADMFSQCVVRSYAELTTEEMEMQLSALRQWAAENPPKPVKTYLQDFLEKFPDARTDENGTPKAWLQNVYSLRDTKRIEYLSMLDRGQWDKPLGYWENPNG